jgi:GNAT superfamily N-acetyltransferase
LGGLAPEVGGISYRSTMAWLKVSATGPGYHSLVTSLLQRIRAGEPAAGVWEAADFQWSWRIDQHTDSQRQTFWLDASRSPVAGIVFTAWRGDLAVDVMWASEHHEIAMNQVWPVVAKKVSALDCSLHTTLVDGDPLIEAFGSLGFVAMEEVAVTTTMAATERPAASQLPSGFSLGNRVDADAPHHMIARSGPDVAERLQECSLYRPDLDLVVYSAEGDVAAYGLFWADPVTGVGMVEPMRTEDAYQGLGLARCVLTAGLDLLAQAGCATLMVTHLEKNPTARHVYLSTGFQPQNTSRTYRREK